MPWCDGCSRFYNPNSVDADGNCRSCGSALPRQERTVTTGTVEAASVPDVTPERDERAPWHFWVMVVAVIAYLGWRAIEGVVWVFQQL